jgi:hypothetical protein
MLVGRLIGMATALLVSFVLGSWAGDWMNPRHDPPRPSHPVPVPVTRAAKDSPPPAPRVPADPRRPEPRAVAARAAAIRRDAAAIEAECQKAAGGDWDKWQRDTAPYRDSLKAKISALKENLPASNSPETRYQPLAPHDDFPLFEVGSRGHLNYLYDPATLDDFRRDRPVVAAHRWLKRRGIDLILLTVPKMTEVYMEHFLDPCPPDGIIAPHVRRTLLELLHDDVEVIDGFSLFRPQRDTDADYLYNTADTHWAPRSMRVMAKEVADRIGRYRFGARARYAVPIVRAAPGRYGADDTPTGMGFLFAWDALTADQQRRARPFQVRTQTEVKMPDGTKPPDDRTSPVLVIGHSYVWCFKEQLVKEMNLLTYSWSSPHQTTEVFGEFLREPELLDHTRVVVWVTTSQNMTAFRPLPKAVTDTLAVGHQRDE